MIGFPDRARALAADGIESVDDMAEILEHAAFVTGTARTAPTAAPMIADPVNRSLSSANSSAPRTAGQDDGTGANGNLTGDPREEDRLTIELAC